MFDFDATLPLMAIQFLALTAIMNVVFFKPLSKVISERQAYVGNNNAEARERLDKVKRLAETYDEKLASSRRQSQSILADAQAVAQKEAAQNIAAAQRQLQEQTLATQQELEKQKQSAFSQLEKDVDSLSRQVLEKLLGPELAR